jgi:hypothetical protein
MHRVVHGVVVEPMSRLDLVEVAGEVDAAVLRTHDAQAVPAIPVVSLDVLRD